jgi:GT2 family glycosyltransferase
VTVSNVAVIVPTLGTRDNFLRESLRSIREAGDAYIVVVAPPSFSTSQALAEFAVDQFVVDPGHGLVHAINRALLELPSDIAYVNWLGDDDLLAPSSIAISEAVLETKPKVSFTYGQCKYIDDQGRTLGTNKSGIWASKLIFFGPDLIPQPGALIRKSDLTKIGNLDTGLTHAFDMDMFIKLLKNGEGFYINSWLASFRWHNDSLSVKTRKKSVLEASKIRRSHFPIILRQISFLWEIPMAILVFSAGIVVSLKSSGKKE